MKRGEIALFVTLVLVLITLTTVLLYKTSKQPITQDVTVGTAQEFGNNQTDKDIFNESNVPRREKTMACEITKPLACTLWSISPDNDEISLQVRALEIEDYLIKNIAITNCETKDPGEIYLDRRTKKGITFICSLKDRKVFKENIVINYKRTRGGPELVANGTIITITD